MKDIRAALLVVIFSICPSVLAQTDLERTFCEPEDPGENCFFKDDPSPCSCAPDTLAVRFENSTNILELDEFQPGMFIETSFVINTKSTGVEGWQFGVKTDIDFLRILSLTIDGTVSAQTCDFYELQEVSGGFLLLWLKGERCPPFQLPVEEEIILAKATYSVVSDPGPEGTKVQIVSDLTTTANVPHVVRLVIDGDGLRLPATLVDGVVRTGSSVSFRRADVDKNGEIEVADAVTILHYLFLGGVPPTCLDSFDVDGDERVNIADPIRILLHLFHGFSIPEPFEVCSAGLAGSALGCERFQPCE